MISNLLSAILEKINLKVMLIIALLLITALFFFNLLVVLSLIIVSLAISFLVGKSRIIRHIGIELVAFTTIITGVVYGGGISILIGLILIIFHLAMSGYFGTYVIWVVPEYTLMGYVASLMTTMSITSVGLAIVIGISVLNMFFTFLVFRENVIRYLPWVMTNIIFNAVLFFFLAPPLVQVLQ